MYWCYFLSLIKHKYHVLKECWKCGLYWQGITHDLSKFLPDEFEGSALFFSGKSLTDEEQECTQVALLKHYHRNAHHPEYWVLNPAEDKVLKMPRRYLLEMICDWQSFHLEDREAPKNWYLKTKESLMLHPETRCELESLLGLTKVG